MKISDEQRAFLIAVGSRIKAIRKQQSMSQQTLSALCNMEKSNISRLENGQTNTTVLTLLKISLVLQVSLMEVLPVG